ncbi:YibE/F family protein [Paenibacillus sp. 19GGS1-52]|uniref:YibE/F family protein n=1 Tax=Paenibacillus sp. 19GGS1-52 TaxID=2758563 RepID=UPI001EFB4AEC|nr:YibE/F family protein [Paenibacillus sp. 19GGS1-52]ULO06859.1 YibE/F family protein [Paenibacillus sp. 19GGS1-52]
MTKSKWLPRGIIVGLLLVFSVFLYMLNANGPQSYLQQSGSSYLKYEKATIIKVASETVEQDEVLGGLYRGSQMLEVRILTGEHKGELHTIKNFLSDRYNVYGKAGMKIVVCVETANPSMYEVRVYSYYRAPTLYFFAFLFIAIMWAIGGKKGLKSVVGLAYTMICIIFFFIPLLHHGFSPILASVIMVIITTCANLFLIHGWNSKSVSAVIGTTIGVVFAGLVSSVAGAFAHISGLNSEEAETLIVIARDTHMQVKDLLFAGILIASLGAIVDVSISVSSSIHEVYTVNHSLRKKELFRSGINVGRDMMGTMSDTLILAFTGSSLQALILIYSYRVPFTQLTNMEMIAIEVIQGLSGSIAVVLTVPIVAFISSRLIPLMNKTLSTTK